MDRSEAVVRAALRDMPDGEWSYRLDCDGYREPVTIAVKVTKRGDGLSADYAGSSSQVTNASINCPFNMTVSDSLYPLKCCLAPHVPNNDGVLRPFSVSAPDGSILKPRRPSPVKSRSKTSFHLHMAIYGALAQAIPERVQAGSGSFWSVILQGRRPADDSDFNVQILPNGGKGATFSQDGLPTIAFPYNGMVTPTEIVENQAPVIIAYKRLACDSGGAGRRRGGLGQHIGFRVVRDEPVTITLRPDKVRYPAIGLGGGHGGAPGSFSRNGESMSVGPLALGLGDVVEVRLPGGGGYGPPRARSVEAVVEDVVKGYVSIAAALRDYGVTIDASGVGHRCVSKGDSR
ncbi:MAG: hydantoinase B/oxoprolinase family protein [Solimonas sp.]